jgi:long-chain acyl-CoA synthetase
MTTTLHSSYPPGVPHTIPPLRYDSVGDMLASCCEQFASKTAFVQDSADLSFGDLRHFGERLATFLNVHLKLRPGDRVALMMPNTLSYPVAICGVFWAGGVIVNVNPMYTVREVRHQLLDSDSRTVIVAAPYVNTVLEALVDVEGIAVIVAPLSGALREKKGAQENGPIVELEVALATETPFYVRRRTAEQTAVLQYTGGTTGPSKGADLMHRNILSDIEQLGLWISSAVSQGDNVVLTALPIYHVFAFTVNVLSFIRVGGKNVLVPNPRDVDGLVATMDRQKITAITGVNTLFNGLLNAARFDQLDFSRLRLCLGGGSAIQPAVARRWQQVTGTVLTEGYGLSETSPVVAVNRLDSGTFREGIGLPLPSTELSIRDDSGREVAQGESGELHIRGPQVMRGYWNKPEETSKAFTADGYFRTGDVAYRDPEGHYHIVDRKKDMVLVSGFNVYPTEIEAICSEYPGVLESACIGIPDERTGEAIKIYVVKKDQAMTRESLIEHFRKNLAAYKVPRHVEFVAELPKSTVGKILRRELRK